VPAVELAKHQLKAIEEMKNGCILNGDVGTGKSRTAIAYYLLKACGGGIRINGIGDFEPMQKPRDLYIITTAKKRDKLEWEEEAAPFGISTKFELGHTGTQLYVDSWNNIEKYKDVTNAFFIFDEQRLVGSGSWVKAFLRIAKANDWILLSATPGDTWMDYLPVFMANGFFKTKKEFIDQHVVYRPWSKYPKIDRYVDTGILMRYKRQITVYMPYPRHTTRHIKYVPVRHDEDLFKRVWKDRWHVYEDRPLRDVGELFIVARKLVNSHTSRLKAISELLDDHNRLIVFYNFNYELEDLRTLAKLHGIKSAEWNGHKHEEVPNTKKWIYLVQYTAGAEGWNCITTDAMAFFSLNYSYKINHQAKGRIDRLNTKYVDLYYYILRSNSLIDKAILKSIAEKKSFNEKDLVRAL
jgi:hypothetical protein